MGSRRGCHPISHLHAINKRKMTYADFPSAKIPRLWSDDVSSSVSQGILNLSDL